MRSPAAFQRWLMDPDECPTQWDVLIRIRKENTNYKIGDFNISPGGPSA